MRHYGFLTSRGICLPCVRACVCVCVWSIILTKSNTTQGERERQTPPSQTSPRQLSPRCLPRSGNSFSLFLLPDRRQSMSSHSFLFCGGCGWGEGGLEVGWGFKMPIFSGLLVFILYKAMGQRRPYLQRRLMQY